VSLGPLWLLSLVALPSLSVTSQQHYPLSPGGLKTPSTLLPSSAPQLTDYPHSLGLRSPYHPPCSMHKAPGKGGHSQPAINLRTLCAFLGLTHHHTPPPSGLAIPTPIIFTRGTTEMDAHTFYPHFPFPGNCPPLLFNLSIPLPIQHNSISSPLLTFL
jgi:hypothetical protein